MNFGNWLDWPQLRIPDQFGIGSGGSEVNVYSPPIPLLGGGRGEVIGSHVNGLHYSARYDLLG